MYELKLYERYVKRVEDLNYELDKGKVRNDSKHYQTCLKNKLKRKKRK